MSSFLLFLTPIPMVILLQAIFLRAFPLKSAQLITIACMVIGIPLYEVLYFSVVENPSPVRAIYFFLLYCFSTYTYFHLFNMSETSRRVRLVQFVGKGVEADRISEVFEEKQMIEARLDRMIALGQIKKEGERYYSSGMLFYFVSVILATLAKALYRPW